MEGRWGGVRGRKKGEDEEGGGVLRGRDSSDSPVGVLLRYRQGTIHCTLMSCIEFIRDISDVYIDRDVTEENITFKYPHYFFLKDALLIELMSE